MAKLFANSGDPDQTPRSVASDLGLHCFSKQLTHCIPNRLSNTIYWKSPISILGTSGYEIYIFLKKNG